MRTIAAVLAAVALLPCARAQDASGLIMPGEAPAASVPGPEAAPRPAAVAEPMTPGAAARDLTPRPTTYMRDLDHLALFTAGDPSVSARVENINGKRRTAATMFVLSAASLVAGTVGMLAVRDCSLLYSTQYAEASYCSPRYSLGILGASTSLLFSTIGLVVMPNRSDVIDTVNAWNQTHPERPIGFTP